jgi:uncharacterized protein (DUF427 family)
MIRAVWNGAVIAQAPEAEVRMVEGNVYFPPDSLDHSYIKPSKRTSLCIWKGRANYYDIVVGDKTNVDAAWYYPKPSLLAKKITGYVAFWNGVEIQK